ncbi:helix-turn-helix domain-containing protein [Mesobacillus zeae]|uniref:DNA-binding protein n=1 Tax=Mesobacillus zeae TaxID=1917180 RepID=A0A398AZ53_9BACI|nr:helix-turn-helix domain-containing protein [Mesobacillus zeae]RID82832.1 DNA-binding protein [Mesobacillus zeae]
MEGRVYTPDEVASLFNISKNTVYEMIKRGELRAFKIGNRFRIERSEVRRIISSSASRRIDV